MDSGPRAVFGFTEDGRACDMLSNIATLEEHLCFPGQPISWLDVDETLSENLLARLHSFGSIHFSANNGKAAD